MAFPVKYHFEKKKKREKKTFFSLSCFKYLLDVSMAVDLLLYLTMSETYVCSFFFRF